MKIYSIQFFYNKLKIMKKIHHDGKYITLHEVNFHYFVFQNVPKYPQPNLSKIDGAYLYQEPLLSFGGMVI